MHLRQESSIPNLLVANLPRELVLSVEEALEEGAQHAFPAAERMHKGHRATVLGQMRHFHMNETFAEALELSGARPSPLQGNKVVVGQAGIVQLGRFNFSDAPWNRSGRSITRLMMARANRAIEQFVSPLLPFEPVLPVTQVTAFFVGVFSRSTPERATSIDIAVPDSQMKTWLFREPVSLFVQRYNVVATQQDQAKPVLKSRAAKKKESGE